MGAPVVHFEILGKDGDALQKFYGELFDWDIQKKDGKDYAIVHTGKGAGIGGRIGTGSNGRAGVTFSAQVSDIVATLGQIEAKGGSVLIPRKEIPQAGVVIAFFADPEGHVIGLVEEGSHG